MAYLKEKNQPLGNRCWHNPASTPIYIPPRNHKPRRGIQQFAQKKLKNFYHNPKRLLINLRWSNSSMRSQRSERREAIYIVSSILLHYMDVATFRIGTPRDDGFFIGLSLAFIATKAGWRLKNNEIRQISDLKLRQKATYSGIKRVQRAIYDLIQAGYLRSTRNCYQKQPGEFRSHPAKRQFTELFFKHLGFNKKTIDKSKDIAKQLIKRLPNQIARLLSKEMGRRGKRNKDKSSSPTLDQRLLLYELLKTGMAMHDINNIISS